MDPYTALDLDEARTFLLQGLWLQRVVAPTANSVRPALEWTLELAGVGQPLPPVGFIADLGQVAVSSEWEMRSDRSNVSVPNLPVNLLSTYEDYVLGKIYGDWTFARASDALRSYKGRDRSKGIAYLLMQICERVKIPGVEFAPGVIKYALDAPPEEVLAQGFESLRQDGPLPLLVDLYEMLISSSRRSAEVLGQEDIFELESRKALAEYGERLALRQVLRMATGFEAGLPQHKLRPLNQRMEVPTRILDEDTYPVGGFTSISNRGTVESLLHSQLAYMETDKSDGPDLFDIKFLRDELLYYSRDENQFLRRRRTFVFLLHQDLVQTQFKDAELPVQRGILLLAFVLVVVRKLIEWLSTDALTFQIVFVGSADDVGLAKEKALLELLLAEQITNETVHIQHLPNKKLESTCTEWARRSLCHCLNVAVKPSELDPVDTVVTEFQVDQARPAIREERKETVTLEADDAMDCWHKTLRHILQLWL